MSWNQSQQNHIQGWYDNCFLQSHHCKVDILRDFKNAYTEFFDF